LTISKAKRLLSPGVGQQDNSTLLNHDLVNGALTKNGWPEQSEKYRKITEISVVSAQNYKENLSFIFNWPEVS
jgi:hypothetical protein